MKTDSSLSLSFSHVTENRDVYVTTKESEAQQRGTNHGVRGETWTLAS